VDNYLTYKLGKEFARSVFIGLRSWVVGGLVLQLALTVYLGRNRRAIEEHINPLLLTVKAIELNPDFCWTYSSLGDVLMELSECEAAVAYRREVIELNPDFFTVL
jgi:tetratricopeptide (TPR) repeat protein